MPGYIGTAGLHTTQPPQPQIYTPGSYTFTPTKAGRYKFVLWGGGGNGGPSGAYVEKTVFLTPSNSVAISIGVFTTASTAALPGGTITAGGGNATPGVASGGDVNLNGSAAGVAGSGTGGGVAGSGAGAPANLPYRGGFGGGSVAGAQPGVPGGGAPTSGGVGGHGLGIVVFIKD